MIPWWGILIAFLLGGAVCYMVRCRPLKNRCRMLEDLREADRKLS